MGMGTALEPEIQAEDLKCCGNCSWRGTMDMGTYFGESCNFDKEFTEEGSHVCYHWNYDGLESKWRK